MAAKTGTEKKTATKKAALTSTDAKGMFPVGTKVFVRTVTLYYVGVLVKVTDNYLVLEDAAWIADTDRWSTTLKDGKLREAEPYPDGQVCVCIGAMVDVCEWKHPLIRSTISISDRS